MCFKLLNAHCFSYVDCCGKQAEHWDKVIYIRLAIVPCPDGKYSQCTSGFGKWLVERKEKRKFGTAETRTCLLWVKVQHINSSDTGADSQIRLKKFGNISFFYKSKYVPQKHLVQVNWIFMIFISNVRGAWLWRFNNDKIRNILSY